MDGILQIPALARSILYYALALGLAVLTPLVAAGSVDATVTSIFTNVAGVFGFTLAAQYVTRDRSGLQESVVGSGSTVIRKQG